MLIQYIRKGHNRPVGCLVAVKRKDGEVVISYSLCRKGDRFSKDLAKKIALGRAHSWSEQEHRKDTLPSSLGSSMSDFTKRAERYFKMSKNEMICYG
jgi:hypothetical protein